MKLEDDEHRWYVSYASKAQVEGWDIFDCSGSANGRWQICKIDYDDEGNKRLDDDSEAWDIALRGTEDHHAFARDFIKAHSPTEWQSMCRYAAKNPRAYPSELLTEILAAVLTA